MSVQKGQSGSSTVRVVGAFAVGKAPTDGKAFDRATYTFGPMAVTGGLVATSQETARPSEPRAPASPYSGEPSNSHSLLP